MGSLTLDLIFQWTRKKYSVYYERPAKDINRVQTGLLEEKSNKSTYFEEYQVQGVFDMTDCKFGSKFCKIKMRNPI